jgi:hypothetical protein
MAMLTAGTWNCDCVGTNPYGDVRTFADPKHADIFEKLRVEADTSEVPVASLYDEATHAKLFSKCVEVGIMTGGLPPFAAMLNACRFLNDGPIGEHRFVSLPARYTDNVTKPGGLKTHRPALTTLACVVPNVDEWLEWMLGDNPVMTAAGDQVSCPAKLLGAFPSKYGAPEWAEAAPVYTQLALLLMFDLIIASVVMSVDGGWELGSTIIAPALALAEEWTERVINATLATGVDVMFLSEASIDLLRKLSETHLVFYDCEATSPQRIAVVISKDCGLFAGVVCERRGYGAGFIAVRAVVKATAEPLWLVSAKSDSSGYMTPDILTSIGKLVDRERFVCGMDPNTSIRGNKAKMPIESFVSKVAALGAVAVPKPGAPEYATTFSTKTKLQPQTNKGAKAGEPEIPDQRDFIITTLEPEGTVAVVTDPHDVASRDCIASVRFLPSDTFPSDHALVIVELAM